MSTLWIFGDSFSEDRTDLKRRHISDLQWHLCLARELGMDYKNQALGGASIEYCNSIWYQSLDKMAPGDLAVVTVTDIGRRWFMQDEPAISIPSAILLGSYDKYINDRIKKAMRLYFKHFYHTGNEESGLYSWICSLEIAAINKDIRVIVLPCFDYTENLIKKWQDQFSKIYIAKGNLMSISHQEYSSYLQENSTLVRCGRANHLTPLNHQVLLSKLLAHYIDGVDIDLTEGFHRNIITQHNLKDPNLFLQPHEITLSTSPPFKFKR